MLARRATALWPKPSKTMELVRRSNGDASSVNFVAENKRISRTAVSSEFSRGENYISYLQEDAFSIILILSPSASLPSLSMASIKKQA